MTEVKFDLKLTDRQILRMVLASQMALANILVSLALTQDGYRGPTADKAKMLAHNLEQVLEGIPK
jgi:hypothetical protein